MKKIYLLLACTLAYGYADAQVKTEKSVPYAKKAEFGNISQNKKPNSSIYQSKAITDIWEDDFSNPNGKVDTLDISTIVQGLGYSTATGLSTSGGSGTGLTVDIEVSQLTYDLIINNGGTGYITGSNFTLTQTAGTGNGSGLTLDIVATDTFSLDEPTLNPGTGYSDAADVPTTSNTGTGTGLLVDIEANPIGGVDSLDMSTLLGGTGYADATGVATTGAGTGLEVDIFTEGDDIIDSVAISAVGTGYTTGDLITIDGGNNDATIEVYSVTNGKITSISVAYAGDGNYTVGEEVTINDGNDDATIEILEVDGGEITEVTITSTGDELYEDGDVFTVNGGDDNAELELSAVGGNIIDVIINENGFDYAVGDEITILAGNEEATIEVKSVYDSWTIDGDGQQGEWAIGGNGDVPEATGYMGEMQSTTSANNFAFFDGVQYLLSPPVEAQNAWIEMTKSVDMTGYETALFSFEQSYRAFNDDNTLVEVSLDNGVSWTQVIDINPDIAANDYAEKESIILEFDVNQSSEVKFRFRWENTSNDDQFGSGYGWFVDDVTITSLPDNDIETSELYFGSDGLTYYQIPEIQIDAIDMSVNVENLGINEQKNVQLSAEETQNGLFSEKSTAVNIIEDATDSLVLNSTYTPAGIGNYTIEFELLNDSLDDLPVNNEMNSYNLEVGEYIYARDKGVADNTVTGSVYQNDPIVEPGNVFRIYADAELYGVDVTLGNSQVNGLEIYGSLYQIDDEGAIGPAIAETKIHTTDNDGGSNVSLAFPKSVSVTAGNEYVVSVGAFSAEMVIATSGKSLPGTSVIYFDDDGTWYRQTNTPMIRMNFDPILSVENNETSNLNVSQNFPNPFSNKTTVEYTLENASEVSYSVVDLTGKTILEVNEGNVIAGKHQITIDGANLANGVYYFNMNADGAQTTHKMIVNK